MICTVNKSLDCMCLQLGLCYRAVVRIPGEKNKFDKVH